MIFRPELAEAIRDGRKTVTRRRSDRYQVGKTYAVQPGRGEFGICRIRVLSVIHQPAFCGYVTDGEAHREGAKHAADFMALWREIHGEVAANDGLDVFRIEFELVLPPVPEKGETT